MAVQIISNIYHNFPEQRTLLVTHSNQVTSYPLQIINGKNEKILLRCPLYYNVTEVAS